MMSRQVTRQRLALGFPRSGIQIAAKSGSLLGVIRNEIGVITMPDGQRYAAAVFTRADRPWDNEHEINAAIGTAKPGQSDAFAAADTRPTTPLPHPGVPGWGHGPAT